MKIRGKFKRVMLNSPKRDYTEIELSAEELARQLTYQEAFDIEQSIKDKLDDKPKPTCGKITGHKDWGKETPEPKPERIELLDEDIKVLAFNSNQVVDIVRKVNEIADKFNHLTRGK